MNKRKDAVRTLSRAIFGGGGYRLEIAGALHSGKSFTAPDLGLGILITDPPPGGSIHTELKCLKKAGLISPEEGARSDRSKSYVALTCAFWEACRELIELAEREADRQDAIQKALQSSAKADPDLQSLIEAKPLGGRAPWTEAFSEGRVPVQNLTMLQRSPEGSDPSGDNPD
jgi:hypothetical protein